MGEEARLLGDSWEKEGVWRQLLPVSSRDGREGAA